MIKKRNTIIASLALLLVFAASLTFLFLRSVPYGKIESALKAGDPDQAIALGDPFLKAGSNDAKLVKLLGEAYVTKAEYSNQRSFLVRKSRMILTHLNNQTNDLEVQNLLGQGFLVIHQYALANEIYQKIALLSPKDAEVWARLGEASEGLSKYSEAEKNYKKALTLDPSSDGAVLGMIRTDIRAARFDEVVKLANAQLAKTSNILTKALIHENLAIVAERKSDIKGATKEFKLALSLNPNLPTSLSLYSLILLKEIPSNISVKDMWAKTKDPLALAIKARSISSAYPYALAALSDIYALRNDRVAAQKFAMAVRRALPQSNLLLAEKKALSEKYKAPVPSRSKK
ncbi:MAG: tetratricopeptide repeat protein [Patescibacteria group bacterium]